MKSIGIRGLMFLILTILSYPSFAGSNSEYGDIIKNTREYKKITKEKDDGRDSHDRHYHYYDYYYSPFYRPRYPPYSASYYDSAGSGSVNYDGRLYLGVTIGESEFDYDDIENGDASIFYIGYRPDHSRLGYELSIYDSGDSEVTSLTDIEFHVDTINLVLTLNSSINNQSSLNLVGKGGIYFADSTLSGPFDSVRERSNGFLLGVGAELLLNQHFSLRADVHVLYDVEDFANDESISILGLGGQFMF